VPTPIQLALFLQTGRPGVSAVDMARERLTEFNRLRNVLLADKNLFCLNTDNWKAIKLQFFFVELF